MQWDLTNYPYPGARRVVMGRKGAVATSQPLATLAGMEMLQKGGSAVDAAIATAITLTVVEPTSNGIGSDAFAIVWDGQLHGLNASGHSPEKLTLDQFSGLTEIPAQDWRAVTVPGAVSAWRTLWEKWGKLPFEQLFEPAIRYAEQGYPVSPVTAQAWKQAESDYLPLSKPEFKQFQQIFFPQNRAPYPGEIWGSPLHAQTLTEIAQTGGESFYQGKLAHQIVDFAQATGGYFTLADFKHHQADWVDPISTTYRDLTVWEIPPNGQGIAALIALNILSGFEVARHPRESVESYHLQIEALKLAFADLHRYICDPRYLEFPLERLLDLEYARERQRLIGETAIASAIPGFPKGGTVYLAAADGELTVSLIQSNYMGFGSGIVPNNTGISLQNRALGFTLAPNHPNQLAPRKRPFHTIIPGFITRNHQPLGAFGVMGGDMQPQGHLQVVVNLADYQLNPQAALDAPRWRFIQGNTVLLETSVNPEIVNALIAKGHDIQQSPDHFFGRGQIIFNHDQTLLAASESRADGMAIAW